MSLFRFLDLWVAGGLLCGGGLLLSLLLAFLYAALRERHTRPNRGKISFLLLLLTAAALSSCGTLQLDVVEPTAPAREAEPAAGQVGDGPFQTATPSAGTATASPTGRPPASATPPGPDFSTVYFCLEPCKADGSNARSTFPAGVQTIYTRWRYQDLPVGATYERSWRSRGDLWVAYDCSWPGPSRGVDAITLTEPDGLRAGTWELRIRVNGKAVLAEEITLTGEHEYWQPVGRLDSCYGKLSFVTATPSATATRPRPLATERPAGPTPTPTGSPSPTPTPTATPVPLRIDRFVVTGVEELGQGRRISFAWEATGRQATIRGETAVSQNPTWTVPLSGTLAVEVAESIYRDPRFTLEVSGGTLLSPTVAAETVTVAWDACAYDYFFEPVPDLCPARAAVTTRIAYQPFERGYMVWRENLDDIFVFYADGSWERYSNLFPGEEKSDDEEPPEGLYRPVRGFGLVWSHPEWRVRERLGWGVAPEGESSLVYQDQIAISERRLPTYWRRAGAPLLYLTSHGGLSGRWEQAATPQTGAGDVIPR